MVDTNVHFHIGLPNVCNLDEFNRIFKLFKNDMKQMPNSITMICALLHSIEEVKIIFVINFNIFLLRIYFLFDFFEVRKLE
jgi:hypothetical protein